MAEKEYATGTAISRAIQAERRSKVTNDRSCRGEPLVKSPQWTKNALQKIESTQTDDNGETAPQEGCVQQALQSIRKTLARHLKELRDAKRQLRVQSAKLQRRREENTELRQTIGKLETEIGSLKAELWAERDARRAQLLQFQNAYDQFEQQTDLILNELDQQNERLRAERRQRKRWTVH